jgi:hypothetical protein
MTKVYLDFPQFMQIRLDRPHPNAILAVFLPLTLNIVLKGNGKH